MELLARAIKLLCKLLAPMHARASSNAAPDDPASIEDVAGAKYHIAFEYELSTRAVITLLVEMSKRASSEGAGSASSTRARTMTVLDAALEYIEGCCCDSSSSNTPTLSRGTARGIGLSLSDARHLTLLPYLEEDGEHGSSSDRRREGIVAWFVAWHVDITGPTAFAGETDASAPAFALSDLVAWAVAVLGKAGHRQSHHLHRIDANRLLMAVLSLVVRASRARPHSLTAAFLRASRPSHTCPRSSPQSTRIKM